MSAQRERRSLENANQANRKGALRRSRDETGAKKSASPLRRNKNSNPRKMGSKILLFFYLIFSSFGFHFTVLVFVRSSSSRGNWLPSCSLLNRISYFANGRSVSRTTLSNGMRLPGGSSSQQAKKLLRSGDSIQRTHVFGNSFTACENALRVLGSDSTMKSMFSVRPM